MSRPLKRKRVVIEKNSNPTVGKGERSLEDLLTSREWDAAIMRLQLHPSEATGSKDPSALALACRFGAPTDCVKQILQACPSKLRHLLGSRGTPLHEAIVCDEVGPKMIDLLLTADVQLGLSSRRATMMQDVDGYTPLHLLIRRRFQSHIIGSSGESSYLMEILEMLVKSSPEAIIVPDRGEYEEPPIVMALKANVYAPLLRPEDVSTAHIEKKINEMVGCMLRYYPSAASCVFNGYRGKYTALHSAVFHGRCAETIELLIEAEKKSPSGERAGLLANTQGEMPLHFCAMRGEPPRSVALVAAAAPEAVSMRDASGLTPLHWLWIRFVSSLLALDDNGRGNVENIPLRRRANMRGYSDYVAFATLFQGDFEQDLALVRRLDPSVDFLRMRHIPSEVLEEGEAMEWAVKAVGILKRVRERYYTGETDSSGMIMFSRIEAVASLFWTKLVSMLEAIWNAESHSENESFSLVHTAFKCSGCAPPIVRIVAELYPSEMFTPDSESLLPLHHAAGRKWHAWDWPRQDGTRNSANAQVLQTETASLLRAAMALSPETAASKKDSHFALPIHHSIRTFVRACCSSGRSYTHRPVLEMHDLLGLFVKLHPASLQEPDPETGLPPFLQASAVATETKRSCASASFPDEIALSVVFQLLRDDPSIVKPNVSPQGLINVLHLKHIQG